MSKFCTKCGKEVADHASYCDGCGKKVGAQMKTVTREEAIASQGKTKGTGGFFVFIGLIFVLIIGGLIFMSGGGSKKSQVDRSFLDSLNLTFGTECSYNISDHAIWYDEDLGEYIGTGSFKTLEDIEYQYNFRAFLQDGAIVFAKVDVYDPLGNHVVDIYEQDQELVHYSTLGE